MSGIYLGIYKKEGKVEVLTYKSFKQAYKKRAPLFLGRTGLGKSHNHNLQK